MTRTTDSFRVALVQEAPVFLNVEATLDRVEQLAGECAAEGARVVVFPETWLPGYPVWIDSAPGAALWGEPAAKKLYRLLVANSVRLGDGRLQRLQAVADHHGVVVVIGAHESHGSTLYNTTFTFDGAGGMKLHRKLTPTYTERLLWGTGDGSTLEVTETEFGTIGGLICWEHWLPLARAAMHARHELLHTAQWPWVREIHEICSRQYAFEGQCFVAASGCVMSRAQVLDGFDSLGQPDPEVRELLESIPGAGDDLLMRGRSRLIGPDGGVIASAAEGDPATVYGEVDPALAVEGRMLLDTDGHYSRPDVFTLHVDTKPKLNVETSAAGSGDERS
jgi:predicted amidohydrolase